MTHKVTVRFGGAVDSEVHDYSDRIRLLQDGSPAIHGGMQYDNGSAGMGELILDDPDNDIPHRTEPPGLQLAAHNELIWSEDSPGYESWLSVGRIDNKSVGRPYTYTAGVERQWTVQWADANIEYDGITLTADEVRPAESDVDRVLWALDTFCNGSPRLTTVIATHLVASSPTTLMPAKTYEAGTELVEIFDDCAQYAGKMHGIVIHDVDSASHKCCLYIDEEDHTTYACTLSISDQVDEVDGETVFEPHWRQGAATEEAGQELVTGLVSRYGADTTATAVVTDTDHADSYDYWVKPYNDDLSVTAAQASARAAAILHSRWTERLTHQPSILIPARLHHLIKAGMSIEVESAAMMGGQYLGTKQIRRIAAIEWGHAGWTDEPLLWANLKLDRPQRQLSYGKVQPAATTPKPPSGSCTDLTATHAPGMSGDNTVDGPWADGGDGRIVAPSSPGALAHSGDFYIELSGTSNPWAWYVFDGDFTAGAEYTFGFWTRFTTTPVTITFGYDSGTGFPAFESSEALTLSTADTDWTYHEIAWTAPSTISSGGVYNSAGVKALFEYPSGGGMDLDDGSLQACSGAEAPPGSDDGTGDPGSPDTGCYSPCDHKHPAQTAAVTPITDSAGDFTATNVEGALAELQSDAEADAAALTAHTGDTSDAHDASAISVLDTGGNFTGTDVEAVLAELQDSIDSSAGATALDDLSDVTITAAAVGDMARYDGTAWVNTPGRWEPVTTNPGTGPELVWDGDEIVMTWSAT